MGYTKTQISDFQPILTQPGSTNVAPYQALLEDIHATLTENGMWSQTEDPGQVENLAITPQLASTTNFRIYKLNDGHDSLGEIFIKVVFSVSTYPGGGGSQAGGYGLAVGITFSNSSSFIPPYSMTCYMPNLRSDTSTASNLTINGGPSFLCKNDDLGFFGLAHCVNSQRQTQSPSEEIGGLLAFIIQRNIDSDGNLIPGFSCYAPGRKSSSSNVTLSSFRTAIPFYSKFISTSYTSNADTTSAVRPFETQQTALPSGTVPISPVFTLTPVIKQIPSLISYNADSIAVGTVFQAETVGGVEYSYVALGNCLMYAGQNSCFAMLYQ